MAQTPRINRLDNKGEPFKDVLPKELTEKLKNYVRIYAISKFGDRLDALEKASELNTLNQASRFDVLSKTPTPSIALAAALKKASELSMLNQQALSKTPAPSIALAAALKKASELSMLNQQALSKTPAPSIALAAKRASELATSHQLAAIRDSQNTLSIAASKALLSLNLYPTKSLESILKNINYSTSIEQALARDWQNVGNDLWKSCLKVSDNQPSDNDE